MEYKFKFKFDEKEYILKNGNLESFFNDEENPIKDIDENKILDILNKGENIEFTKSYFNLPCSECNEGKEEKKKVFDFLGFNFYIYTKDNEYVVSSIDNEYEGQSFIRLQSIGKVDNSYIAIINVCRHCGAYSIEIEEFEL